MQCGSRTHVPINTFASPEGHKKVPNAGECAPAAATDTTVVECIRSANINNYDDDDDDARTSYRVRANVYVRISSFCVGEKVAAGGVISYICARPNGGVCIIILRTK